ncbi:protein MICRORCHIDIA 6-like isoform X2 [Oryza brachyantha]|uniref:protein MICRORCHIDIA 6-like isoform X2 n=1 Tax=Oryza brachyantha TaxID=4533 RepID=UPI000776693D|nr:protein MICRORCHIDIA 6-like isoform X2 [Oryza brachyantha]
MAIIDYVDLSDDEIIVEEPGAHGHAHGAGVQVELIDLATEEDGVEDQNIHGKDDAVRWTTLHRPNFVAAHGQGNTARHRLTLCKQRSIAVGDDAEEAMQSGKQKHSAVNDGIGDPTNSADQEIVAAGDCTEEVILSVDQDFAAEAADTEETMKSGTRKFVSEGYNSGDVMQSGNAAQATTSSSMTEQGAITCSSMTGHAATTSSSRSEQWSGETAAFLCSQPMSNVSPFPRQFWKAGEYSVAAQPTINSAQNHLRIHPKFLHSNATSHKWAFGAVAELLDNAVDEVNNGATFVKIDKIKCSPIGEYSLVIQDDGGGMNPESLRRCMSFGFSTKSGDSFIGQYGNGFKTSTMRLGTDVIVFSCTEDNRLTRSIGLLSYTFLTRTGCDDIFVPVVDYEFDASSHTFKTRMDHGEKQFFSNLSTLLRWSPFTSEDDLLNQFEDMGCHGTKIIVFNLWFNDAWEMELDFTSDEEDIMISGAPAIPDRLKTIRRLNHMHVANRFRYSLRVYASILYLQLPKHFKIILCGRVVEPHHVVNDLIYRECIKYRPQVGINIEIDIITTIGYLRGAPKLDIHGFNVYHKNRLILPFWSVYSDRSRSKGIAGVLEANFIRPTHDKQDFEKTGLFHRLETRLKDMTLEYWRYHAHLVGYARVTQALPPAHYTSTVALRDGSLVAQASTKTYDGNSRARESVLHDHCSNGEPSKRTSSSTIHWRAQKRQNANDYANQPADINAVQIKDERIRHLISVKKVLKAECSKFEAAEQQLLCKAESLRNELLKWQRLFRDLTDQLKFYDGQCPLQRNLHCNHSSFLGYRVSEGGRLTRP